MLSDWGTPEWCHNPLTWEVPLHMVEWTVWCSTSLSWGRMDNPGFYREGGAPADHSTFKIGPWGGVQECKRGSSLAMPQSVECTNYGLNPFPSDLRHFYWSGVKGGCRNMLELIRILSQILHYCSWLWLVHTPRHSCSTLIG